MEAPKDDSEDDKITEASVTFQTTEQEEDDEQQHETLYEATELREFIARRSETGDILEIKKILKNEDYTFFKFEDPTLVLERCCFSLTLSDIIEADRIVAAAFFDDKPIDPILKTYSKQWKTDTGLEHLTPLNTFYLHLYAGSPEVQTETLLTEIVANTFSACPLIDFIIVEQPDLNTPGPFVFCSMVKNLGINPTGNVKKIILIYEKDMMFPGLKVREGREHDLDDLAPLLPMDSETISKEFGKAGLSDIIAMSDKNNQSMVGEWNSEAVGIISVSTDIDYERLNQFYHLEPFHGLHKPHSKDEIEINYEDAEKLDEIPVDEIMEQARQAMESFKGNRRHRPPEKLPYSLEGSRGDDKCAEEYESEISLELDSNEKNSRTHQFGLRVSEDIILYGLRSETTIGSITERGSLTSNMENLKSIKSGMQVSETGSQQLIDEDEEEGDEEEEQEHPETEEQETLETSEEKTQETEGDMRLSQENEEWEQDQLLNFYTEFIGEDIDYDSQQELHQTESLIFDKELEEENANEKEASDEEDSSEERDEPAPLPKRHSKRPSEEPEHEDEEETLERQLSTLDTTNEDVEEEEEEEEEQEAEEEEEQEEEEVVQETASKTSLQMRPSTRISKSPMSTKSVLPPTVSKGVSKTPIKSSTNMAHFHNKEEFQRRVSDDTIYLGKTGTDRKFEEKVELMKKVWEVYQSMKHEGLTLEAAKMYLPPNDMDALAEADILTKGSLLKFLTALLPDDKMYPFERPMKPKVPVYHGLPNALAIKLFNIEKKFSLRSLDLFRAIFKCFPNREYLIVTVPQGSKEPAWLDNFVRAVPRVDSSYPRELFVIHKVYLTSKLKVRRAKVSDIPQIIRLLATIKDHDAILEDFKMAVCCRTKMAFVAEVRNHPNVPIVGMAVASEDPESQIYHINYDLDKHTYFNFHDESDHAYVNHLIIYPIFQRFSQAFMKEVMRMMDKTCLYHRIYSDSCQNEATKHQSTLNNLDDWIALMPRKRVDYDYLNLTGDDYDLERRPPKFVTDKQDPYSVVHMGKKFAFDQKISMNSRIVFVGASETTISCIEKMISSSFRGYKRLTIIDPYGLPGQLPADKARDEFSSVKQGGKSMSFNSTTEWVQRLGIKNWTNVVLGWVTKIVRDKKYVVVDKERIVPYDFLILAPGLQFQRPDCPEAEIDDPNFVAFKNKTNPSKLQGKKEITFKREIPKPKNVFTVNTEVETDISLNFIKKYMPFMKKKKIIVFGGGLRAYACIKGLLVFGVPPTRIVLITTPGHDVEWEATSGYILTSVVRVPIVNELKKKGIHVVDNYEFSNWETCKVSGLVKRVYFTSPTEVDSQISFSTFAMFCFRYKRVNDDLVSALSEAYIVYQNGIIIDEGFKTNDPNIFAAGPATVYKRILLAGHQEHRYFQSEEIGQKLAEFLIEKSGSEGGGVSQVNESDVVKFERPFVRSVVLIGSWHYLYLRSPGAPLHTRCVDPTGKCDESCECSTEIVTGSVDPREDPKQRFFQIRLDEQSRVIGVECMSKKPFSASNLIGLYGQHEVVLNKMMERLEKGETKDLYDHFCQPWFGIFCIDHWETFHSELQQLYKVHTFGEGQKMSDFIRDFVTNLDNPDSLQVDPNIIRNIWDSSGLKQNVELKFLDFLKFHKLALPMYARNDYVEDLLEERSTSTLYYNKAQNY